MKTYTKKSSKTPSAPPVAKLRLGRMTASIWGRSNEAGVFHSATFERRYRDSDGNWHSTHSYDATDLLALAKLADMAHTRILDLRKEAE